MAEPSSPASDARTSAPSMSASSASTATTLWSSKTALLTVAFVSIVVANAFHYATQGGHGHAHGAPLDLHAVLRRVMTLPIALAAVVGGMRSGTQAAALASVLYVPHAFFSVTFSRWLGVMVHGDPSSTVEKVSELVVYFAFGVGLGALVDRNRRMRATHNVLRGQLEVAERDLMRADRLNALGELAAGVAHEVRNPLAALTTTGEILAEAYPDGHARHRMARLHLDEIARLGRVVDRFLSFAKPTPPSRREVNVAAVVEQVSSLLRTTADTRGVRVVTDVADDLTVWADSDQLVQLLLNLGLNALQASPDDGEIAMRADRVDGGTIIDVTDAGVGLSQENLERAFDPCFTTRPEGSGLGLSIAARIAYAHDGTIQIANQPEGGARVRLSLPLVSRVSVVSRSSTTTD